MRAYHLHDVRQCRIREVMSHSKTQEEQHPHLLADLRTLQRGRAGIRVAINLNVRSDLEFLLHIFKVTVGLAIVAGASAIMRSPVIRVLLVGVSMSGKHWRGGAAKGWVGVGLESSISSGASPVMPCLTRMGTSGSVR